MDSAADKMFQNHELKNPIMDQVCQCIDEECTIICSRNTVSLFHKYDTLRMNFEWIDYVAELKNKAPAFYRILSDIVSHSDKRNKHVIRAGVHMYICLWTKKYLNCTLAIDSP